MEEEEEALLRASTYREHILYRKREHF